MEEKGTLVLSENPDRRQAGFHTRGMNRRAARNASDHVVSGSLLIQVCQSRNRRGS